MPLQKTHKIDARSAWCLWEISETLDELKNILPAAQFRLQEWVEITNNERKKQWAAARAGIGSLIHEAGVVLKDKKGRQYLENSDVYISCSHTSRYAAAIVHQSKPTGIDIQLVSGSRITTRQDNIGKTVAIDIGDRDMGVIRG